MRRLLTKLPLLTKQPQSIQMVIAFLFNAIGLVFFFYQLFDFNSHRSTKDPITFPGVHIFVIHLSWFGKLWSTAFSVLGAFLGVLIDYPSYVCELSRTKRTCLHFVTFLLCEAYSAIFVVRVHLQNILSDVDATICRSSFYVLEMFIGASLMAFNTINHLMLIYHTFYAIEPQQWPHMTRLKFLICVLQIIPFTGTLLLLILPVCNGADKDLDLCSLMLLYYILVWGYLCNHYVFTGNDYYDQCKLKSFILYLRRTKTIKFIIESELQGALVFVSLVIVVVSVALRNKYYDVMGLPEAASCWGSRCMGLQFIFAFIYRYGYLINMIQQFYYMQIEQNSDVDSDQDSDEESEDDYEEETAEAG